ncbi:MAG: cytochrome ubiquinol oxidase subunit I [Deltaproteobacteria bacterium]|nr:cytochrome ubiquinol oxidase subunit I [Deltaproteobacteria bacterium]
MDHLELARSQMAFSLGFHIIFASISMVMPFLMFAAYRNYLRDGQEVDLRLTRAWMKGSAILFATGAVTGTTLSFQLGLLWPEFMRHAGPIFGMPFSLEGAAFFLEAIFLGLFLYGWDRLSPRVHLMCAFLVGVCGLASGALVIAANGWMNAPTGFDWVDGQAINIDPWAAMFNDAWPLQALHMLVAAFQATSMAAIGLHSWGILRQRSLGPGRSGGGGSVFHRRAMTYLVPILVVTSLLQPLIGDRSAKSIAERQPEKFAAMESHFRTEGPASLLIGGWPDEEKQEVSWGIHIPGALSFLAHGSFDAEVRGLEEFPRSEWPPVLITHLAFQIMVGLGMAMLLVSLIFLVGRWRGIDLWQRAGWLRLLVVMTPAGFLALEAGWVVTEVGRQPWILYRILETAQSVTPVPGLGWSFALIVLIYSVLGTISFSLLWKWFQIESVKP